MIKVNVIFDDPDTDRAHALANKIHTLLDTENLHDGMTEYSNKSADPRTITFGVKST